MTFGRIKVIFIQIRIKFIYDPSNRNRSNHRMRIQPFKHISFLFLIVFGFCFLGIIIAVRADSLKNDVAAKEHKAMIVVDPAFHIRYDRHIHIKAEHPHVSKTTVYRNLNLLAEDGSIRKIQIPGEADRFDHNTYDHYHVRCLKCGKVFDVDMAVIPDMESRINDNHGFVFLGCDIVFRGICPKCKVDFEKAKSENEEKRNEE